MLEVVTAGESIVFVVALAVMLLIGVLELVGLGAGHVDLDLDVDGAPDMLGWLGIGRLPFLMLLVVFLSCFGIIGLVAQQASHDLRGTLIDPLLAVPGAALLALPATGIVGNLLARIMPRDHTTAVDLDVLVGRRGRIVTGTASAGCAARARVEDQHGQAHYVMVEPNTPDAALREGDTILLVRREGDTFHAIDPEQLTLRP